MELTKTVPMGAPFHFTCAPDANPLPVTVILNAALPAVIALGSSVLMVGAATIVNVRLFELTPPACTATDAVPTFATRLPGTSAVSWFAL